MFDVDLPIYLSSHFYISILDARKTNQITGTTIMNKNTKREIEYNIVKLGLLISIGFSLFSWTKGGFRTESMENAQRAVVAEIPTFEYRRSVS